MKIWQLCFDVNNYANLQAFPPLTADDIQSFNGTKKLAGWTPLRVEPIESDLELGDAPGFTIPVFSQKACDILMPLMEQDSVTNCGEIWSAREAILNGAKFDELSFQSVYASNGSSLEMCDNCYHTFVEYLRSVGGK